MRENKYKVYLLVSMLLFIIWPHNSYSQINMYRPACQNTNFQNNKDDFGVFNGAEIKYDQIKFRKEVLGKFKLNGNPVYGAKRKWFPFSMQIKNNGIKCNLNGKMRLTGDLNDHIEFSNGVEIFSSILFELKDESINGVKRFKLLLPQTRNGMEEIFSANLISELGFLAPRTSFVTPKLNGKYKKMIFQEDLVKEFLEYNKKVEGPIFEGDERFGIRSLLSTAKISNFNWAAKSKTHLLISKFGLNTINFAYLTHSALVTKSGNDPLFDVASSLSNVIAKENSTQIEVFDSLILALNADHLLSRDDSRFYFDFVRGSFHPIYYDGQPSFFSSKVVNSRIATESAVKGVNKALEKIDNLNIDKLLNKINSAGMVMTKKELVNSIFKLRENLKSIKNLKIEPRNYSFNKSILTRDKDYADASFLIMDETNSLLECKRHLKDCSSFTSSFTPKILAGKEPKYAHLMFLGNILNPSDEKSDAPKAYPLSIMNQRIFTINDKTNLYATKDMSVQIDKFNHEIKLNAQSPDAHALIEGGTLIGWHIDYKGTKNISNRNDSRFFSTGLTGCLNLRDLDVKELTLSTKNTACEDAINTVRVTGTIKSIEIENASEDGLDLDFSDLHISKVNVKNAGNDCLDLSYGNYKFGKVDLQNCSDKALSSGETAKVSITNLSAKNIKSAIVVKDSSIVEIQKANLINFEQCVALYRKKSEFLGGTLKYKEINCDKSDFYVQENSLLVRLPQ